jgi:AraC family transcriptional regulator
VEAVLTNSSFTNATLSRPLTGGKARPSHGGVLIDNFAFQARRGTDEDIGLHDHLPSPDDTVEVSPRDLVKRRTVNSRGMTVDIIQTTKREHFEYRYRGPFHMLVAYEQGVRRDGVTIVEGLARSSLHDLRKKLTFVPAGHDYHEVHDLRALSRMTFFFFDPAKMAGVSETGAVELAPRLYFENASIWDAAFKLTNVIDSPNADNQLYLEALGTVLAHELARLEPGATQTQPLVRGGLAAWQQRIVTSYIEEHLSEQISLATLSRLVRLSPFHFCRAFKQSFGIPPHRYHTTRRIERAKTLLAKPEPSVTDIGLTLGFGQTSSFTAAFRRATGFTPTSYHRSLG